MLDIIIIAEFVELFLNDIACGNELYTGYVLVDPHMRTLLNTGAYKGDSNLFGFFLGFHSIVLPPMDTFIRKPDRAGFSHVFTSDLIKTQTGALYAKNFFPKRKTQQIQDKDDQHRKANYQIELLDAH